MNISVPPRAKPFNPQGLSAAKHSDEVSGVLLCDFTDSTGFSAMCRQHAA